MPLLRLLPPRPLGLRLSARTVRPAAAWTACVLLLLIFTSDAAAQRPVLVSVRNADVTSGSGRSDNHSVSASGRFVAFESVAFNLATVPDDNGRADVFVRDQQTGQTITVSVNAAGGGTGNGGSFNPVISADGRFVAFESDAGNLVPGDTNNSRDVFVRDLQAGTTALVSAGPGGAAGNKSSASPSISADGRVVVFNSHASDLVAGDANNALDVFARDLGAGTTALVSANAAGNAAGNDISFFDSGGLNKFNREVVSDDGRYVVFTSHASDLSPLDPNRNTDSYVRDLQTNTTTLVSVNQAGTASGNVGSAFPVISGNGRYVFFQSGATDLASNDTMNGMDLFVRDLQASTTSLVSVTLANTGANQHGNSLFFQTVSPDGRFVAFSSASDDLAPGDGGGKTDAFVRDLQTNTTRLVSVNAAGTAGAGGVDPSVSPDGRYVAFTSFATDIVATPDANGAQNDVFLRDLQAGTTTLLSLNLAGTATGAVGSSQPRLSGDGRVVVFLSNATDLVPNRIVASDNVFALAVNGRALFEATSYTAGEADGSRTVTVRRTGGTGSAATINYTTAGGTATPGADYTATSGTLSFAAGEETKSFSVPILDDPSDEPDETLALVLSDFAPSPEPASLHLSILTLTDDDAPPAISINDVTVVEGNSGTTLAVFTLRLSEVSGKTISVDMAASPVTADPFADYRFNSLQAIIGPGSTTLNVAVPVVADMTFEGDETFVINLSNPSNATIADAQAVGTIRDDDPLPSLFVNDFFVAEGDEGTKEVRFFISLTNPSDRDISVNYSTSDVTAHAGSDYVAASGTLHIFAGQRTAALAVQFIGDTVNEASEAFLLNLSNPVGVSLPRAQAVASITNDDSPALIQFSSATYNVDEAGTGAAVITVTRSGDTSGEVSAEYFTFNGQASDRSDYTFTAGTLRFGPGELSKSFTVYVTDDTYAEVSESLALVLVNPNGTNGASIGSPATAQLFINSEDTPAPGPPPNPADRSDFFVRQHYRDFLGRDPDPAGLAFWTADIEKCGADAQCREVKRVNVSAAFFLSIEFQNTGYLVYRLHGAAFNSGERLPLKTFLTDTQEIGRDVVVGEPGWDLKLEANKRAFLERFVERPLFRALYPQTMSAAAFVEALAANTADPRDPAAGGALTQAERDELAADLAAGRKSRAEVLRAVAENAAYQRRLFNRAFVYMQYAGYLRRAPIDPPDRDFSGYNFWLSKLEEFGGNYIAAEMVKAFISSDEYRKRFGQ